MKILHLSTNDCGGAGMAAFRFHKNLEARGIDSKMLVLSKYTEDPNVIPVNKSNYFSQAYRLASRVLLKIRSNPDYYFQDQAKSALNNSIDCFDEIDFHPDIIVAHWISNFVSLEDLYQIHARGNVPVIWHLMDMAPITGGCHYAWDCVGYMSQCGNCPALYSSNARDLSSKNWRKKYDFIQRMNITIVPATGWQMSQAGKAKLFSGKRKEKIMAGIDAGVFKPCSRAGARKMFNLPVNKKVLFVGSQSMKQRRKGIKYFLEAVRILEKNEKNKDNIIIVTAGDITVKKSLHSTSFKHFHLGFLNEDGLVKAYQAADVFVCPSVEDSGPIMINESIMCGTPVVAFEMGVSVDLVHTNVTGYRATLMDSDDLAKGILQVLNLDSTDAQKMSSNCRDIGIRLTSDEVQVNGFMRLFDEIITENYA
ncbi:MAG: hypothetical protein BMS9Abin33_0415 [Gammaproteobacteria bacterium]|nr:MAG: hypothetical protein BMS9Abin33_0415 [Gammaproteobacteria bacterium]